MNNSSSSKILEFAASAGYHEIKLNLGSGGRPLPGWINIDNYDYEKQDTSRNAAIYDVKCDIRNLEVPAASVDVIMLVHVLEHFVRWDAIKMLRSYFEILKPGGALIVEMPDFDKCIEWYLRGRDAPHMHTPIGIRNMGLTQFYGNQWDELDYETHRYVWTLDEFLNVVRDIGYEVSRADHAAVFHRPGRDMFVLAKRPEKT
jgi:predicted SAM-dependent methyltransferase